MKPTHSDDNVSENNHEHASIFDYVASRQNREREANHNESSHETTHTVETQTESSEEVSRLRDTVTELRDNVQILEDQNNTIARRFEELSANQTPNSAETPVAEQSEITNEITNETSFEQDLDEIPWGLGQTLEGILGSNNQPTPSGQNPAPSEFLVENAEQVNNTSEQQINPDSTQSIDGYNVGNMNKLRERDQSLGMGN